MNRLQSLMAAGLTTALSAASIGAFATAQGVFAGPGSQASNDITQEAATDFRSIELTDATVAPAMATATPQVIYRDLEPIVVTRQVFTTAEPVAQPASSSPAPNESPSATATSTTPTAEPTQSPTQTPVFALAPEQPPVFASGSGSGFDDNGGDRDDDWDDDDHDSDDDDWDDDRDSDDDDHDDDDHDDDHDDDDRDDDDD